MLTHDQILAYERDGFVLVENLFNREEQQILLENTAGGTRSAGEAKHERRRGP